MTSETVNRTAGGRFEQELAEVLAGHGFWVHVFQQNKAGQPADIVAIKGKFHTLIDCKVISDAHGFPFERVEENQKLAMRTFFKKCGELSYFALRLPDGSVHMVSMERIETLKGRGKKRLSDEEIRKQIWSLDSWLESSNTWAEDL